jgi:hypothetical protein
VHLPGRPGLEGKGLCSLFGKSDHRNRECPASTEMCRHPGTHGISRRGMRPSRRNGHFGGFDASRGMRGVSGGMHASSWEAAGIPADVSASLDMHPNPVGISGILYVYCSMDCHVQPDDRLASIKLMLAGKSSYQRRKCRLARSDHRLYQ